MLNVMTVLAKILSDSVYKSLLLQKNSFEVERPLSTSASSIMIMLCCTTLAH